MMGRIWVVYDGTSRFALGLSAWGVSVRGPEMLHIGQFDLLLSDPMAARVGQFYGAGAGRPGGALSSRRL
jgi:hypothetical protein